MDPFQEVDMMAEKLYFFGSRDWFEAVRQKMGESEDFMAGIADWQGKMRCINDCEDEQALKDFASEEGVEAILSMLGMLSAEERAKYRGTGLETVAKKIGYELEDDPSSVDLAAAAKAIAGMTIEDFKGFVIYSSFWPDQGTMKEFGPITPDDYLDAPFTMAGKYTYWKQLCSGEQSSIQLLMGGKMKLEGDLKYLMKHTAATNALVEVYKSVPLR